INQSGEQLLDIINNILEFANLESGRSLLDFNELSLNELANSVIAQYQSLSEKQKITLSLDSRVATDADTFSADAKRLRQIVSNLVHNALKFTPVGGQVELRLWREPQVVVFQIVDTGIGIPESQQDVLFEKFKQLESPFQRQYSGTGLGLAMTKRLVELHGGLIQVDSQVGRGSTFTVRLPVRTAPQGLQPYQVPFTLGSHAERVVLLETDENNAAIVCEMLTAAGYEVIWLVEADQLAAQLDLLRPVMLIADLALLDTDVNTIKTIQLAVTALNTKVLALISKPTSMPSAMAHHDILRKPIEPKRLLSKVRQLMMSVS
ncbi:MAG: hybrid sensor histidine kinase/response regulator, partial [Phormidesmis sp. RL_2_1]|nr:hybrid sensor histidine kinase/response regulator [Phormidesmis sp. RL_2_1]